MASRLECIDWKNEFTGHTSVICFGSRGPGRSPGIRHRNQLTAKAWEKAVQEVGNVHTTQKKFENRVLFLRLGLPPTLTRRETGDFRNLLSNWRNLKTAAFAFSFERKTFYNGAFRKRWRHVNQEVNRIEFSSNKNPKWPVIVSFSNSSGVAWTEKKFDAFSEWNSSGVVWKDEWPFTRHLLQENSNWAKLPSTLHFVILWSFSSFK